MDAWARGENQKSKTEGKKKRSEAMVVSSFVGFLFLFVFFWACRCLMCVLFPGKEGKNEKGPRSLSFSIYVQNGLLFGWGLSLPFHPFQNLGPGIARPPSAPSSPFSCPSLAARVDHHLPSPAPPPFLPASLYSNYKHSGRCAPSAPLFPARPSHQRKTSPLLPSSGGQHRRREGGKGAPRPLIPPIHTPFWLSSSPSSFLLSFFVSSCTKKHGPPLLLPSLSITPNPGYPSPRTTMQKGAQRSDKDTVTARDARLLGRHKPPPKARPRTPDGFTRAPRRRSPPPSPSSLSALLNPPPTTAAKHQHQQRPLSSSIRNMKKRKWATSGEWASGCSSKQEVRREKGEKKGERECF